MNIFQKVTLKTLKENKTRTIVTIIGIILSLSMFTAVTTSVSSFQNYMRKVTIFQEGNWHGAVSVTGADRERLAADDNIETVSFLETIGYARLTDCTNPDKPYLFIGGMDEHAADTLPIHITDGRMPENENELLLPLHLSYNGGVNYNLGDTLTLDIGQRISVDENGTPCSLGQDTPYLYTKEEQKEAAPAGDNEMEEGSLSEPESETFVPSSNHTYTVVGFYERPSIENFSAPGYTALTMSKLPSAAQGSDTADGFHEAEYTAYLRFEDPNHAIPWLDSHYSENYQANYRLLRMYGASFEDSYNRVLYSLATVLIAIILFGSISLIYNAFSISVTERTRQFGLLASLGATKKQLVRSVLFEAFCLCVAGIPLGIFAGIAGIGITFSLLGVSLSDVLWGGDSFVIPLTLHISPLAILIAALIGLFTVLISAYLPARRAAKLSPMDAIRQTKDIAIRPGKVKTSKLTYCLFGLSGMLASKNFKRNRKKYRATVVSLFVSVVLFISASSFCSYLTKSSGDVIADTGCDIRYYRTADEGTVSNDEILKTLSDLDGIKEAAFSQYEYSPLTFDRTALSQKFLDFMAKTQSEEELIAKENAQNEISIDAGIYFINDRAFEDYLAKQGLPPKVFMNPERPLAVASDFLRFYQPDTGKYTTMNILASDSTTASILQIDPPEDYVSSGYYTDEQNNTIYYFDHKSTGKTIEVPEASCTTTVSLTIGAVLETVPFFLSDDYSNGLMLLYPASAMETVLGPGTAASVSMDYTNFYFTVDDHKKATADISDTLKNMGLNSSNVSDYAEQAAGERTLLLIINVFSYGFIILISLIAAANVFNTISTNIQLRKREFAMLESTGMEPKGFTVMMCYECLLYGIKGLLYGLPVSIIVTYWIYRSVSNGLETSFYIPWPSLSIAICSVFLVVGSTMIYSMGKIRKENIIDNLKNDNI